MQVSFTAFLEQLSTIVRQGAVLALGFLDDLLLMGLSQMGFHWVWLQWLSTALLVISIAYWAYRIVRYCHRRQVHQSAS
ncbi:MAG: hypothetical protein AAFZ80_09260 [Cyanobacteria bacterium P01_A01_bin.105]